MHTLCPCSALSVALSGLHRAARSRRACAPSGWSYAEAFETGKTGGKETGSIPNCNSHVAPRAPPQPHSKADQAAKPSKYAALHMARAPPVSSLQSKFMASSTYYQQKASIRL